VDVLRIHEITQGDENPEYIKLHGSIDWWLTERGTIVRSLEKDNPFEVLTNRTMIYPIYEKFVSKNHFFALYQYFRKMLFKEDILIVIGFSFRDPSINNAIADWLSTRSCSRLLIVANEKNQNKIRAIFNDNPRIQFINTYFGHIGFTNSLEDVLANPIP
jgi:SIR2-like domain